MMIEEPMATCIPAPAGYRWISERINCPPDDAEEALAYLRGHQDWRAYGDTIVAWCVVFNPFKSRPYSALYAVLADGTHCEHTEGWCSGFIRPDGCVETSDGVHLDLVAYYEHVAHWCKQFMKELRKKGAEADA